MAFVFGFFFICFSLSVRLRNLLTINVSINILLFSAQSDVENKAGVSTENKNGNQSGPVHDKPATSDSGELS